MGVIYRVRSSSIIKNKTVFNLPGLLFSGHGRFRKDYQDKIYEEVQLY